MEKELNLKKGIITTYLEFYTSLCPQKPLKEGILSAYSRSYEDLQEIKERIVDEYK